MSTAINYLTGFSGEISDGDLLAMFIQSAGAARSVPASSFATYIRAQATSGVSYWFDNWLQASSTQVASTAQYIMVAGVVYQKWTGSSGLSLFTTGDGAMWAPPAGDIRAMHFKSDGVTDQQVIERCIAWCAAMSATVPTNVTADRTFGLQLEVDMWAPVQWQMTGMITLSAYNAGLTLRGGSFKMTGNTWTDADPYTGWNWHSYPTTGQTASQIEALARQQFYRPRKSDYLFKCGGSASRVNFEGMRIDCGQKGGGISLSANCRLVNSDIDGIAGVGVAGSGGGATVDNCYFTQWNIGQDPQYYDKDAYTGICILAEDTDFYIQNCRASWAYELVRFEKTNNVLRDGHYFNGMQGYNFADRTFTSAMRNAVYEYFVNKGNPYAWANVAAVDATNFTPRTKHVGFTTAARRDMADYNGDPSLSPASALSNARMDTVFHNAYVDNLHCDFYTNGWEITDMAFGLKKTSSLSAIGALVRAFAPSSPGQPRFEMINMHPLVESVNFSPTTVNKHYLELDPGNFGETWTGNYTFFNADVVNNWISTTSGARGLGWTARSDRIEVTLQANTSPNETQYNPDSGSFTGWRDAATNATKDVMAGAVADVFHVRQQGGTSLMQLDVANNRVLFNVAGYANDAAAGAGGLTVGMWYYNTGTNVITRKT